MAKFMVPVSGKLVVDAEDKDLAKEVVRGLLATKQPWLEVPQYATVERIYDALEVSEESLVS